MKSKKIITMIMIAAMSISVIACTNIKNNENGEDVNKEDNVGDSVGDDIENGIENDIEDSVGDDIEDTVKNDIEDNVDSDIESDANKDADADVDTESDTDADTDADDDDADIDDADDDTDDTDTSKKDTDTKKDTVEKNTDKKENKEEPKPTPVPEPTPQPQPQPQPQPEPQPQPQPEPQPAECQHKVQSRISVDIEATCTTVGMHKEYCKDCGVLVAELPLSGTIPHKFVEFSRTPPTCTKYGSITEKCTGCQKERFSEDWVTPYVAHTWKYDRVEKAPECDGLGLAIYVCTVCKGSELRDIPKTPHPYDETGFCTVCGDQKKEQ